MLAAGIAGGVEAALAAMQGNPRDTELLGGGDGVPLEVARGDLETTGRAINAGAFEITEAAKAAHPNNASVQQHCDERSTSSAGRATGCRPPACDRGAAAAPGARSWSSELSR